MTEPLQKVDSAVQGLDSPVDKKDAAKRRQSSAAAPGVSKIQELGVCFFPDPCGLVLLTSATLRGQWH